MRSGVFKLFEIFFNDSYFIQHLSKASIKRGEEIMDNFGDELITVDELCEMLMIGKNLAYRLLSSGEIKCFKISRSWKIPRSSVIEYITRQCANS